MKIYILRHGQTEWNKVKRLQGITDISLNENGEQLAYRTGVAMGEQGIRFDACISSPLKRAERTARLCLLGIRAAEDTDKDIDKDIDKDMGRNMDKNTDPGVPFSTDPRIREVNLGPWEGLCMIDHPTIPKVPEEAFAFFRKPEAYVAPKGAESYEQIIARTGSFLGDLAEKYADYEGKDMNLLVSSHGCASRGLLMNIDPVPLCDYWRENVPPNCSVSIAELRDGKWKLIEKDICYASLDQGAHRKAQQVHGMAQQAPGKVSGL